MSKKMLIATLATLMLTIGMASTADAGWRGRVYRGGYFGARPYYGRTIHHGSYYNRGFYGTLYRAYYNPGFRGGIYGGGFYSRPGIWIGF